MDINLDTLPPSYSVDLHRVANYEGYSSCTRLLASNLINNPYVTPGEFIVGLSDYELEWLLESVDKLREENEGLFDEDEDVDELILITLMLSQAEGVFVSTEEELFNSIKMFSLMLVGIRLSRDGIVKAYPEKFSFGEDMQEEVIFEMIKNSENDNSEPD